MVLIFRRLYKPRAKEAAGDCGRGGAALRREGRFRQIASWAAGVEAHWIRWRGRRWSASRLVWKGGVSVWYNVGLRNNKLLFQWTDAPIIW